MQAAREEAEPHGGLETRLRPRVQWRHSLDSTPNCPAGENPVSASSSESRKQLGEQGLCSLEGERTRGVAWGTLLCEATPTTPVLTPGLCVAERRACDTLQNVSCWNRSAGHPLKRPVICDPHRPLWAGSLNGQALDHCSRTSIHTPETVTKSSPQNSTLDARPEVTVLLDSLTGKGTLCSLQAP